MYGRLRSWFYLTVWILVMVGLPLAASALNGERYGLSWYLPRVLFPTIGSWLAYKWFQSIIRASEKLDDGQASPAQRGAAFQTTAKYLSHPLSYAFALLIVAGIAWSAYFGAKQVNMFGRGQGGHHLAENWLFLAGSLPWWYLMVRAGEVAVFTFFDFRRLLSGCDPGNTIDLLDKTNAYGLGRVVNYTHRFVVFYAVIVGCYIIYYQVIFHHFYGAPLTSLAVGTIVFSTAWIAYLAIGFTLLFAVVSPAKHLLAQAKADRIAKISKHMKEVEESDAEDKFSKLGAARQELEATQKIELSVFPFGWARMLSALAVQVLAVGVSVMLEFLWGHFGEIISDWLRAGAS
jgi:hypothetical protein